MRRWVLAGLLAFAGCASPKLEARHQALQAERDALRAYVAAPQEAVVPFADVLVVIRSALISELVRASLPLQREVGGRYTVRVDDVNVTMRPGIALVDLSGEAWLTGRPSANAAVTLVGSFEVDRPPEGGDGLTSRVRLYGFESDLSMGPLAEPAEGIVTGLARSQLTALTEALSRIQIPLRLTELIRLPEVAIDEITIPATTFPLQIGLDAVRVLEPGVFVSLSLGRVGGKSVLDVDEASEGVSRPPVQP